MPHELLGYAQGGESAQLRGDSIWPLARKLGARKYDVDPSAVNAVGVKLDNHVMLDVAASSDMPVPQVRF